MLYHGRGALLLLPGVIAAAFALAAAPAHSEGLCDAPAQNCGAMLPPSCLDRVGASSLPTPEGGDCDAQLDKYRECLTTVISACARPKREEQRTVTLPSGDMLAIWNEVKDSGDANALETFAQNFEGTTLGALAASRARSLREETRQAKIERDAKEVWAHIKDADAPEVLEAFAAEFPNNQWAYKALDLAAKLRAAAAAKVEDRATETTPIQAAASAGAEATAKAEGEGEGEAAAEAGAAARAAAIARNRDAQTELNRLGYDAGPVDGAFGERSRKALIAFQRAEGLTPDGKLTKTALTALRAAPTPASPPVSDSAPETAAAPNQDGQAEAPDELQAKISWRLRRGLGETIEGSCETVFTAAGPAQADGVRTYANTHQRCEADTVTYRLSLDPRARTATGELQVATYEGTSRQLPISGQLPTLTARLGNSQLRVTLSRP